MQLRSGDAMVSSLDRKRLLRMEVRRYRHGLHARAVHGGIRVVPFDGAWVLHPAERGPEVEVPALLLVRGPPRARCPPVKSPGLLQAAVDVEQPLEVSARLHEVPLPHERLRAAVQRLDVLGLGQEHRIARPLGAGGVAKPEAAGRHVEPAGAPDLLAALGELGLAQEPVPHWADGTPFGAVQVVEQLLNAPVPLVGKPEAALLEQRIGDRLAPLSKLQPLLLREVPDVWALRVVEERHAVRGAASGSHLQLGLAIGEEGWILAGDKSSLVLPHLQHGTLERVADLPVARDHPLLDRDLTAERVQPGSVVGGDLLHPQESRPLVGRGIAPRPHALLHHLLEDCAGALLEGAVSRLVNLEEPCLAHGTGLWPVLPHLGRVGKEKVAQGALHRRHLAPAQLHQHAIQRIRSELPSAARSAPEDVLEVRAHVHDRRVVLCKDDGIADAHAVSALRAALASGLLGDDHIRSPARLWRLCAEAGALLRLAHPFLRLLRLDQPIPQLVHLVHHLLGYLRTLRLLLELRHEAVAGARCWRGPRGGIHLRGREGAAVLIKEDILSPGAVEHAGDASPTSYHR
mmetsp:Transcript_110802/g.309948  ORF Transcript_110802/g.309948 Transcript_110802/m.309948 type:complete len:574 (-) Transcript_110802:112-1833(-)